MAGTLKNSRTLSSRFTGFHDFLFETLSPSTTKSILSMVRQSMGSPIAAIGTSCLKSDRKKHGDHSVKMLRKNGATTSLLGKSL